MTKEHVIEQLRRAPLHDRQRLLGRRARPAAGRQRLPRRLPGHHAGLQLPRRVVAAGCSTWTTRCCAATSRTRRAGRRAWRGRPTADRAVLGPPELRQRDHLHHGDRRRCCDPSRSCPGVAAEQVYDAKTNPKGVRCSLQDYMVNVFGRRASRTASPAGRGTTSASSTACKALMAGKITPAQFVDVNAKVGGRDIDYEPTAERARRRPARRSSAPTAAARSTRPRTSTRSRSSTCAAPTRAPSTTSTAPTRCARGSTASTAPPPTRCCGAGRSPLLGDPTFADESIVAMDEWLAAVEKDTRDIPLAQKIIEDKPADAHRPLHQRRRRRTCPPSSATRRCRATRPRASRRGCRSPTTRSSATSSRCGASTTPGPVHRRAVGAAAGRRSRTASATTPSAGVDREPTVPWLTYENGPGGEPLGPAPVLDVLLVGVLSDAQGAPGLAAGAPARPWAQNRLRLHSAIE